LLAAGKVTEDVFPARHESKLSLRRAPDACASTLRMEETAKRTEMLPIAQGDPRLSRLRHPLRTHKTRARRLSVFFDEVRDRATSLRHPRHGSESLAPRRLRRKREPWMRTPIAGEPAIAPKALPPKLFEAHLSAPRYGRVVGAKRTEAMTDEHANVAHPANAARAFGKMPAALAHGASGAKASARRRRRARTSLARDGRQRTLVLFGTGSAVASHHCCTCDGFP